MKKILLSAAIMGAAFGLQAQTLKEVSTMVALRKFQDARPAIDKLLTSDQKAINNPEAWYYKGTIYNMLSLDSTISPTASLELKNQSFEAYKKVCDFFARFKKFICVPAYRERALVPSTGREHRPRCYSAKSLPLSRRL